jgi:hypothetical protein
MCLLLFEFALLIRLPERSGHYKVAKHACQQAFNCYCRAKPNLDRAAQAVGGDAAGDSRPALEIAEIGMRLERKNGA